MVNELKKSADIIEIKRNAANIDMERLNEKTIQFRKATGELSDYKINLKGLSMNDM